MTKRPKTWCVYALVDPLDGSIFYYGMSCKPKQRTKGHKQSNGAIGQRISMIHGAGKRCILRILYRFTNRLDARDCERYHIEQAKLAGIKLLNIQGYQPRVGEKPGFSAPIEALTTIDRRWMQCHL